MRHMPLVVAFMCITEAFMGAKFWEVYAYFSLLNTARPSLDNAEAESELVSRGDMREYSSFEIVFFFLSECSILFYYTLTATLFFGGGLV